MFEVDKKVKVKKTSQLGIIKLLIGVPYRVAWVALIPGAQANYDYVRLYTKNGIETETLNMFEVDDLEILE
jgi:hypothetical protein